MLTSDIICRPNMLSDDIYYVYYKSQLIKKNCKSTALTYLRVDKTLAAPNPVFRLYSFPIPGIVTGIIVQGDPDLLSGFPWPINRNPDNNLESPCRITQNIIEFRCQN
jgi:hypothetical protein